MDNRVEKPNANGPDSDAAADQSPEEDEKVNPFESPAAINDAPEIDESVGESRLVKRLRRQSGNDLVLCAVLATVFAWFIPFGLGLLLHITSLFLLVRMVVIRVRPHWAAIVLAIVLALWNLLNLAVAVLGLLWLMFP